MSAIRPEVRPDPFDRATWQQARQADEAQQRRAQQWAACYEQGLMLRAFLAALMVEAGDGPHLTREEALQLAGQVWRAS